MWSWEKFEGFERLSYLIEVLNEIQNSKLKINKNISGKNKVAYLFIKKRETWFGNTGILVGIG